MKNTKLNNNGFSLVELIVVIAIMAILVGVLAPSVLGQLDKAKISKDKQTIETVVTAVATAFADQTVLESTKPTAGASVSTITFGAATSDAFTSGDETQFDNAVKSIVGYGTVGLESTEYKGQTVTITVTAGGKVTGTIVGTKTGTFTVTR